MRLPFMPSCLGAIAPLFLPLAAHAQIAVDTFGPGGTFSPTFFYNFGGGPSAPSHVGFGFVSQASGPLSTITAPIFRSGTGSLTFELYATSATPGIPGAVLFSTPFSAPVVGSPLTATTLTLPSGPLLTTGVTYYAVFSAQVASTQIRWFIGGADPMSAPQGPEVFHFPGQPWLPDTQAYTAFQLTVPSPAAALLLACIPFSRRRRHHA